MRNGKSNYGYSGLTERVGRRIRVQHQGAESISKKESVSSSVATMACIQIGDYF